MKQKFNIGDVLSIKFESEIHFVTQSRSIDTDELKEAVDLFIRRWVMDDQLCPVIEEINDEKCN